MAIKITEKTSEEIIPFYKLELGAVFVIKERDMIFPNNFKYLKIRSNEVDCNFNAINLTNGCFSLEKIGSNTEVAELHAELILEVKDC